MKKISLGISCCLLFVTVLFTSCTKDGPAGATGPAGPAGAAGAAGSAGPAGPAGAPGTANVIYSAWLDVTYAADTIHVGTLVDTVGFVATIPAAKMTAAIISSGEIKVYINIGSSTTPVVAPLPYFDIYTSLSINPVFYLNNAGVGTIELYADANLSTVTVSGVKYQQYRYILIPGGTTARSVINWNNYKEVQAYLNLKD